jgi:hypothetical protein
VVFLPFPSFSLLFFQFFFFFCLYFRSCVSSRKHKVALFERGLRFSYWPFQDYMLVFVVGHIHPFLKGSIRVTNPLLYIFHIFSSPYIGPSTHYS